MAVHLRVYPEALSEDDQQQPDVRVRLGDLLALIAFAKKNNYLWLQDFLNDEVVVTADLYDVLQAFGTCLRPSA